MNGSVSTKTSTQSVPHLQGVNCYSLSCKLNMILNPFSYIDRTESASVIN